MSHADLKLARRALLRANNPGLARPSNYLSGVVVAAKNMRIELKAAFPGIKFSVRSSSYSGGNSINVSWVDGPMDAQVDAIIAKYKAGSFSGMDDLYTCGDSDWGACFGEAWYVFSNRDYSDEAIRSALRQVGSRYAANLAEAGVVMPSLDDWKRGHYPWAKVLGNEDVRDLIWQAMSRRTNVARPDKLVAVWPSFEEVEVAG